MKLVALIRHPKWFPILLVLSQLLFAFLALWVLWSRPGWPGNHEEHVFALRVQYYLEEFRSGTFFGFWSQHENYGLGSPLGLFYPRLFSTLATLLFWVGLPLKSALIAALTLLGAAGGMGLFLAFRELRLPRIAAWLLSGCFTACNYVQTDIIQRGAMAEFAAIVMLTYLIWWSIYLVNRGKFHYALIPIAILLYFGHTAIMLFAGIIPATAFVLGWLRHRAERPVLLKRAFIATGVVGVVLLPWVLVTILMRSSFLFDIGYLFLNCPRYYFLKPWGFLPLSWRLPIHTYHIAPWLDAGFLLGIAVALLLLGCLFRRHRQQLAAELKRRQCFFWLLLLPLAVYFFLMNELSWPLYRASDLMLALQFPWRLLAHVTILELVIYGLLLKLLHGKLSRKTWYSLALAPAALTLLGCIVAAQLNDRSRLTSTELADRQPKNWVEYYPVVPKFRDDCPVDDWRVLAADWLKRYADKPVELRGPAPQQLQIAKQPDGSWRLVSSAREPYILILPTAWSDLHLVSDGKERLGTWRTMEDPRLRVAVPAGEIALTADIPSWGTLFRRQLLPLQAPVLPPQ